MIKKCLTIISSLVFTATGIIYPLNTKAIEDIEPVEVVSIRSEYEKHYDNGDGTYTAYIDTVPLHYYKDGEWVDINNTLIQDENGNYTNSENSMNVTLSSKASVSETDNDMVSIDYNGYSLSWSLIDTEMLKADTVMIDKEVVTTIADEEITTEQDDINNSSVESVSENIDEDNNEHFRAYNNAESIESYNNDIINEPMIKEYPISELSIIDMDSICKDIGMNKLNAKISKSVSNLNSSAVYDNIYEAVDCKIDIQPNSVKETLILENPDSLLEEYSYFIKSDGLVAELCEDNSVVFSNGDESIFKIPAPFMFDSSDYAENNYNIKVTLEESNNGYIYTLIPDMNWLKDESRIYPVMIDPYVVIPDNTASILCRYNSEANPKSMYSGVKVGGESGNAYETYINIDNRGFADYPSNMCITDAGFYIRMKATPEVYKNNNFTLYAVNNNVRYIFYDELNIGKASYCKYVKELSKDSMTHDYGWTIDITDLANTWFNNSHCNGASIGIPQYGFKLVAQNGAKTLEGYDVNATLMSDRPYFYFTYEYSDDYYLPYSPERYNNIMEKDSKVNASIENFQNKMNCYSYALQSYYRGSGSYALNPGEIGLSSSKSLYNSRKELMNAYESFTNTMKSCIRWDGVVQNASLANLTMTKFNNFIKAQMIADADVMGFNIRETSELLPDDFNEESERIIAMVTCYKSSFYGYNSADDNRTIDFHYLLRNGNGTCPNGHGGDCSAWTQKVGLQNVVDDNAHNSKLCDKNINSNAYSLYSFNIYRCPVGVTYFRIDKPNNIYNSYYGDGRYDECTGIPYYNN